MAKGKRRAGWIVNPGGVSYPSRRRAKRVARTAGGRVEGRGYFPWFVLVGMLALAMVLWWAL